MVITEKRRLGNIGENVAAEFLTRHGYTILDRNYLRKWGELDIVAERQGIIHFVEVKSVSRKTSTWSVTHGTFGRRPIGEASGYRPEENVHPQKLRRLGRTIQTYLLEKRIDGDWQFDIITALVDEETRQARVEILENIII
jgi:putative endonuclease